MRTIKIEIPNGYEIDSFDKLSGEIKLKEKPKPVFDRIKTVADVVADNGLTQEQFVKQCVGLSTDEVAYRILKLLIKSLNEGWTPSWDNHIENKYYPRFEMGGYSGFQFYAYASWQLEVGSHLCFKSAELAEYAGKQFTGVYKEFML